MCIRTFHRISEEGGLGDGVRPVGLVRGQARGGLAVELQQFKLLVVNGGVEVVDRLLQLLRVEAQLGRELFDGVGRLGLERGGVVHPAWAEAVHDSLVGDEVARVVVITPALERDHLEGGEEVALALVVEALAVVVDHDTVAVAPDH